MNPPHDHDQSSGDNSSSSSSPFVVIRGLKNPSCARFNGAFARRGAFSEDNGRWDVTAFLAGKQEGLRVKPGNLTPATEDEVMAWALDAMRGAADVLALLRCGAVLQPGAEERLQSGIDAAAAAFQDDGSSALAKSPLLFGLLRGRGAGVFDAQVLTRWMPPKDRAMFAKASRACHGAVVDSGLPRADRTWREPFELKDCGGAAEVLAWTRQNKERKLDAGTLARPAARDGRLDVLQWLRKDGCQWATSACACAAAGGHLATLKWLRKKGCPWDCDTTTFAADSNQFATLKWVRQNGCEWNVSTCAGAASNGNWEMLKWARDNGCYWDVCTCAGAA
jgi:hypothetical protein